MAKYKGIVHITSSINLSKNMINNAMWELGYDYVEKAALPQLRVAAEEGKKAAEASAIGKASENLLVIGTGSPRRIIQLRTLSGKLGLQVEFKDIRGNITTRLDKLRRGEYDGIVLAKAGLDRIGADLSGLEVRIFEPEEMIPAVGQGMLACECRESDAEMRALLDRITPPENYLRYEIERGIFCRFRCDCRSAVGIHARISQNSANLLLMYEE